MLVATMLDLYTAAKEGDLPKLKELLAHPKVELSWTAGVRLHCALCGSPCALRALARRCSKS